MDDEMDFEGATSAPQQPQATATFPQAEASVSIDPYIPMDGNRKMLYANYFHGKCLVLTDIVDSDLVFIQVPNYRHILVSGYGELNCSI